MTKDDILKAIKIDSELLIPQEKDLLEKKIKKWVQSEYPEESTKNNDAFSELVNVCSEFKNKECWGINCLCCPCDCKEGCYRDIIWDKLKEAYFEHKEEINAAEAVLQHYEELKHGEPK